LNNKLLTSLGSLRRLDISHNGITEMEEDVLQSVKYLVRFFLNLAKIKMCIAPKKKEKSFFQAT